MGITIGTEFIGDLVLEVFHSLNDNLLSKLFCDITPKTCHNFYVFCNGSEEMIEKNEVEKYKNSYKDSIFFRCIKDGFIQGGDLLYGSGNEGVSIYGELMSGKSIERNLNLLKSDENFIVPHDQRGLLTTVNDGRHSNNSQFMITLGPTKWMDCKQVCFGRVVEGFHTLNAMENIPTVNQRPIKEIKIESIIEITPEYLNTISF
ncbi:putative inactive peptidyl-prolyl cis-trans isomerase-like 6 [Cichlidogyrus casuarinus]|uniref:Peptidyl-prolyl cis-trans isomerase n=1 Tax=Cichlidogyrus casuarinus TaxID=1844966 RepID=A0ABD2QNG9_9PLAT